VDNSIHQPDPEAEGFYDYDKPRGPSPFLVLALVIGALLVFFAWGNGFPLVDIGFGRTVFSAVLSVVTAVALFGYMVWRDGMPSMREHGFSQRGSELGFSFVLFFLIPLMAGLLGFAGFFRVINCVFDTSTPDERVVKRLNSIPIRSKMEGGVRGWFYVLDGDQRKWITLPREDFKRLQQEPELEVTTRAGAFGGEWVTEVKAP
jgi:hypothetical protein